MKKISNLICILAILSFTLFSCKSDSPIKPIDGGNTYTPSDSARNHFLADATDFALDYLFDTLSPDTTKIIVPDSILNKYLFPLACLYDKRFEIPILDTLIIQMRIHKYRISSSSLFIRADTTFEWVQNVKAGITPTGNIIIDSLTQLYKLSYKTILWGSQGLAWFTTTQPPMNNNALSRAFLSTPGVVKSSPNSLISFTSKLEIIPTSSETTIYLYKGYGDCIAGCFGYDRWTFTVNNKFEIEYNGYLHQ